MCVRYLERRGDVTFNALALVWNPDMINTSIEIPKSIVKTKSNQQLSLEVEKAALLLGLLLLYLWCYCQQLWMVQCALP
jgi:hypothetical protein